eukprot:563664-Rhodomonas_salina.1
MMGSLAVGPYSLFTVRFLAGVCMGGGDLVAFVYMIELSKLEYRATTASVMQGFFACGVCFCSAIAVAFPSWRQQYLVSSFPAVLFVASYFWVPESPKWLGQQLRQSKLRGSAKLANSSAEHASEHRFLLNLAGGGGTDEDADAAAAKKLKQQHDAAEGEEFTYTELLNDPHMSRNLLLVCGVWLQGGFTYYGITCDPSQY